MTHFVTLVVVDGATHSEDLEPAVAKLLEPFDEELVVEQYVAKTRQELIAEARQLITSFSAEEGTRKHLAATSKEFAEALDNLDDDDAMHAYALREWDADDIDESGALLSTRNPQAKWDWWVIGGRWNNFLKNSKDDRGANSVRREDLAETPSAFACLTKDGQWHEQAQAGWWGITSANEMTEAEWKIKLAELIAQTRPMDWIVAVDLHY